ncbi:MAG: co-chaperone GroES [Bacteroidales bacterium]|nr:co-chaperone GroES [Bacteroidales bacterium]
MKELQPVNQQVLLDFEQPKETTQGGIIIPDSAKEKPKFATVVALSGIENAEISVGDSVFYKEYSGTEINFEGKDFLLVPYADIMAKIVETDEI